MTIKYPRIMGLRMVTMVALMMAALSTTRSEWHANPTLKLQEAMNLGREAADSALSKIQGNRLLSNDVSKQTQALQDCRDLVEWTSELLSESIQKLSYAIANNQTTLSWEEARYYKTWASAALTNYDTCFDALEESKMVIDNYLEFAESITKSSLLCSHALQFINDIPVRPEIDPKKGNTWWQSSSEANPTVSTPTITVAQDGSGSFKKISEAIQAVPKTGATIYVKGGIYVENIEVSKSKKNILLVGEGINVTVITANKSVADGVRTFNTATLAVRGHGFRARNITIENTAGPARGQAVAMRVQAHNASFYRCSFKGYQDTLYVHSYSQYFRECDIYGTVDFIFGNSAAVFQNCNIYARTPGPGQFIAITAQGRKDPNQNTGIVIHNCNVTAAKETVPLNKTVDVFLGRPWKNHSRTVFMESSLSDLINPKGWLEWNGEVPPTTIYYGEYNNSGPGAATQERVKWPSFHLMNVRDAQNFTVSNFIHGDALLPSQSVPFDAGLLS